MLNDIVCKIVNNIDIISKATSKTVGTRQAIENIIATITGNTISIGIANCAEVARPRKDYIFIARGQRDHVRSSFKGIGDKARRLWNSGKINSIGILNYIYHLISQEIGIAQT